MKRVSKPRIGILHPEFRYYSSADTDVSRTFARVRKQMKAAKPIVVTMAKRAKA